MSNRNTHFQVSGKTRLPVMTYLCNKAVETYNRNKDASSHAICQIEDRLNNLSKSRDNQLQTETLIANSRINRAPSGHLFVRLDA